MASSPDFSQPVKPPATNRINLWLWLAIPLLGLTLIAQAVLADRARLAADPVWRPRIVKLCAIVRCTVPVWYQPDAIHITSREIRPHPSATGALLVTATFRNDAAFPQAWPQLQLSLDNLDGDTFGLRRFSPQEYLGSKPVTALIDPAQSATMTLEIIDPGKRAVAFGFEFH
jgi:hypothetical protein